VTLSESLTEVDVDLRGDLAVPHYSLRGSLRDWAEALLDERRLRAEGLLDAAWVRTRWTEFLAGRSSNLYVLWTVLMFEAWYEQSRAEWSAAA